MTGGRTAATSRRGRKRPGVASSDARRRGSPESMSTTLVRLRAPETRRTALRRTPNESATAVSAASVALPSTARALTRTTRAPSCSPPTPGRAEPGFTRIVIRMQTVSMSNPGQVGCGMVRLGHQPRPSERDPPRRQVCGFSVGPSASRWPRQRVYNEVFCTEDLSLDVQAERVACRVETDPYALLRPELGEGGAECNDLCPPLPSSHGPVSPGSSSSAVLPAPPARSAGHSAVRSESSLCGRRPAAGAPPIRARPPRRSGQAADGRSGQRCGVRCV
jgi:hypothetical protein